MYYHLLSHYHNKNNVSLLGDQNSLFLQKQLIVSLNSKKCHHCLQLGNW